MDKKGFVCTNCGNKKPRLTSALEHGFHQRRQRYEERFLEGVSDMCNVCDGLTFFLNLDDNTDDKYQKTPWNPLKALAQQTKQTKEHNKRKSRRHSPVVPEFPKKTNGPAIPLAPRGDYKSDSANSRRQYLQMKPIKRSQSCVPKPPSNHLYQRRSQSLVKKNIGWLRVTDIKPRPTPIIQEVSYSSDVNEKRRAKDDIQRLPIKMTNRNDNKDNKLIEDSIEDNVDTDGTRKKIRPRVPKEVVEPELQKLDESLVDSSPRNRKKKRTLYQSHRENAKPGTSKPFDLKLNQSDLEKKLKKKRDVISKLCGMRQRLDDEFDKAQTELFQLQYKSLMNEKDYPRKRRELGGAHITLPEIHEDQVDEDQEKVEDKRHMSLGDQLLSLIRERHSYRCAKLKEDRNQIEHEIQMNNKPEKDLLDSPVHESLAETSDEDRTRVTYKNKVDMALNDHLIHLIKESQNAFIDPEETPVCSSFTAKSCDVLEKPTSCPSKSCTKSARKMFNPIRKVPKICYAISSVQRARYKIFNRDPRSRILFLTEMAIKANNPQKFVREPPIPQFTTVPCSRKEVLLLLELNPEMDYKAGAAQELAVDRTPIRCPDFDCKRLIFISDFNRHLLYDHRTLTMERIGVKEPKTFFLDLNITFLDRAKCHMLYFIRDKIIDTHGNDLSELLPVLVMSARVYMSDMYGYAQALKECDGPPRSLDTELLLIWLTSYVPKQTSITGTISVWSTRRAQTVRTLYVHTSEVYDVRAPQDMLSICHSTSSVVLPSHVVRSMTNNGENLLGIQVQVY